MADFLCPIIEFSILFPGMLLAYLPMRRHLRKSPQKTAAMVIPPLLLLCLAGGWLCYLWNIRPRWLLIPAAAAAGFLYIHTLHISRWKSSCVFLAVCGVFSYLGCIAFAFDAYLKPGNPDPWLSPEGALAHCLMCWIFVGIAWHPSTHGVRDFIDVEIMAQSWYVFWLLPLLFMGLALFLIPIHPELLLTGRSMKLYIVTNLVLLILLLSFYVLFYFMATSLHKNDRLHQENLFLSMQQAQYHNLQTAIAETRRARHDMRHHFSVLQGLARRGEWETLINYLREAQEAVPDVELSLCENPAADGVISHYAILCKDNQIPFSAKCDLPSSLPVSEMDLCLALSNLLENALEASLKTAPSRRQIRVNTYLHSNCILLLTVENTYDEEIKEKDGTFQSSKRTGGGIGIQSVRHISEKNGGYSRFSYHDGIFFADVMLRGK